FPPGASALSQRNRIRVRRHNRVTLICLGAAYHTPAPRWLSTHWRCRSRSEDLEGAVRPTQPATLPIPRRVGAGEQVAPMNWNESYKTGEEPQDYRLIRIRSNMGPDRARPFHCSESGRHRRDAGYNTNRLICYIRPQIA